MVTDKERLIKGIRFIAIAFPFIFLGPMLLYALGIPAWQQGNVWWLILSVALMAVAAYFGVRGLRTILAAFFSNRSS